MVSQGKKRYHVTLTEDTVDAFKAIASEMSLSPNAMSMALDEYLSELTATMSHHKGKLTFTGIMKMIAEESDIEKELRHDAEKIYEVQEIAGKRKKA